MNVGKIYTIRLVGNLQYGNGSITIRFKFPLYEK